MDKQLQQKLFKKYPEIFQDRFTNRNRMQDGITCGNGWYELIDQACNELRFLGTRFGVLVTFSQVKAKKSEGTLRIYVNPIEFPDWSKYRPCLKLSKANKATVENLISKILHYAMCKSSDICEECGNYGPIQRIEHKHVFCLCNKCWGKLKKGK